MASKALKSAAFILTLNLVFFTLVSSNYLSCPPAPKTPKPPAPKPTPPSPSRETCPINTLKLGVCANVLNDLVHLVIGTPPSASACCSLIKGLVDLEAAVCLCTAIKVGLLGINLNLPVDLSLLVNHCGKKVPAGFQCA